MVLPTGNRSYKAVFTDKKSLSKKELFERLWTQKMIDDFLVDHDGVEFSNHVGWPRYVYHASRVQEIEQSDDFKKAFVISLKRRGFSKSALDSLVKEGRLDPQNI